MDQSEKIFRMFLWLQCYCSKTLNDLEYLFSDLIHSLSFQEKEGKSFWVKWTHFSITRSFWVHLPILQPLVHATFFTKLRSLDNNIKKNQKDYTVFATKLNSNDEDLEVKANEAVAFGKENHKNLIEKNELLAKFLELKLLEAFLEAGPQFAFQISVILQDGISSKTQIFTIVTSALSLTWASSELYLKNPTEVNIYVEQQMT